MLVLRMLSAVRLYPNRFFIREPFKIVEYEALMSLADLQPSDSVLDVGCGSGLQTVMMSQRCDEIQGVDLSEGSLEYARRLARFASRKKNIELIAGDITRLELPESHFDKVLSYCVLEHIPDWELALRRIHRCLRPGGRLIISVDSLSSIKDQGTIEKHRKHNHVAHYFHRDDLKASLEGAGFGDVRVRSIFTSEHAADLFAEIVMTEGYQAMNDVIPYRLLRDYLRLKSREIGDNDGGSPCIFLIASAQRPAKAA